MKANKTLVIWDTDSKVTSDYDILVLWQSYVAKNKKIELSIPQLVEDNSLQLRSKYLEFIYKLGETIINGKRIVDYLKLQPSFSFWWTTLLTEKCNYAKSPQIDNIIKLMAFQGWLLKLENSEDISEIFLVSANIDLSAALRLLAVETGIKFKAQILPTEEKADSWLRKCYSQIPILLQSVIYLFRYLHLRWHMIGVGVSKWKKSQSKITFISYLFHLEMNEAIHGVYKSNYWTTLPDMLERKNIKTNWLHIYDTSDQLPSITSAKKIIKSFNSSNENKQNHVTLDSFLSMGVIIKSLKNLLKFSFLTKKLTRGAKQQCSFYWPLFEKDFKLSLIGKTASSNLLFYFLFERAMALLPPQKRGIYLQENQGWEACLISSWSSAGHGNQLIGNPHATVRDWDLRYYFDPRSDKDSSACKMPVPDTVLVNGSVAKKALTKSGYPLDKLFEVEALRYLHLNKKVENKIKSSSFDTERNQILVLGDYLMENTVLQMKILQQAGKFLELPPTYLVKPHPYCSIASEDYPDLDMTVTNEPIYTLFDYCSIAYTNNVTSAAVDAYCAGKIVLSILDPKKLNLSPLRGFDGAYFVSTAEELAVLLNKREILKPISGQGLDYFYLDPNLPRWEKLLIEESL